MKFPYGIADFHKIITAGYYYVDRSERIALLEEAGEQLLFLRPRRFGKTAWLSTLENYYDLARADEFDALFGKLAIGRQPTPRHNGYFVLRLDFSMVRSTGTLAQVEAALHRHLAVAAQGFFQRYAGRLVAASVPEGDGVAVLHTVVNAVVAAGGLLYLLIDEYDNFANELMQARQADYETLVSGEGLLKTVFKAIKALASGQGIDRVFITGVSPIVLSDISSGYNVASDLTLDGRFIDLCGFTEEEVADVLMRLAGELQRDAGWAQQMLATMRTWYNGYRFGYEPGPGIYNPTLALYFLQALANTGQPPRKMLDSNLAMDRNRIDFVARQPHGFEVVGAALDPESPPVIAELADRFGVEDMRRATRDAPYLASLLYYLGVLTLKDQDALGRLVLGIPNLVIRKLYVERIRDQLLPDWEGREAVRRGAEHLYGTGELAPLIAALEERPLRVFDNRDYRWSNELVIKTVFLMALFNDIFYVMDSEPAIARGYSDLAMLVREEMRRFALLDQLFEFKYLPPKALGLTGEEIRGMEREELARLPVVASAFEAAEAQLLRHRQVLAEIYGARLRLHTHAVVALGFERLLWRSQGTGSAVTPT